MKFLTLEGLIARTLELYDETVDLKKAGVRLKLEIGSRRKQADRWRRRAKALEKEAKEMLPLIEKGRQAAFEAHIAEVMDEGEPSYRAVVKTPKRK